MKCQYCNQHEAEMTVGFRSEGQTWEMHLCPECARRMQQFAAAMFQKYQRSRVAAPAGQGPTPGFFLFDGEKAPGAGVADSSWVPQDAGEEMKKRRRINELKARLEEAIALEKYEEAAQLRDTIYNVEKGVQIHD